MGTVYSALDTRMDRTVALKVLEPERQAEAERLAREADAISRLAHSNICALFVIGSEEVDFLVMEFLEVTTLDQRLQSGSFDRLSFFRYAIAIAMCSIMPISWSGPRRIRHQQPLRQLRLHVWRGLKPRPHQLAVYFSSSDKFR